MTEPAPNNIVRLRKYLLGGVFCGMLASQFVFIVIECNRRLDREFSFRSFVSGVDEIYAFTFLFLFGGFLSCFIAIPGGFIIAFWVDLFDLRSREKVYLSGLWTSAIISFLTVSAIAHWAFEGLANT